MNENVKVIFEGIKNALGESSSVITDRTIEQTINEFSAFAPQENAEKFWNESVVNHLKNTVAGQVRAFASDKRKGVGYNQGTGNIQLEKGMGKITSCTTTYTSTSATTDTNTNTNTSTRTKTV